jgi:hypothetical protein
LTLVVTVAAEKPELAPFSDQLNSAITKKVTEGQRFKSVSNAKVEGPALEMRVTIVNRIDGSRAMRMMNMGGEAEFVCKAELVDTTTQASLGAFDVTGNSSRTSQTSIGGVNTSWFDSLDGRAMLAVAEQIDDFLAKKK